LAGEASSGGATRNTFLIGNKQVINMNDFNSTYHVEIEESQVSIMW
jgi:hypothetical protein